MSVFLPMRWNFGVSIQQVEKKCLYFLNSEFKWWNVKILELTYFHKFAQFYSNPTGSGKANKDALGTVYALFLEFSKQCKIDKNYDQHKNCVCVEEISSEMRCVIMAPYITGYVHFLQTKVWAWRATVGLFEGVFRLFLQCLFSCKFLSES